MAWVYILKCSDGSYYTGSTSSLERRVVEHQDGTYEGYTSSRRPVELVFSQETNTDHEAFLLERQVKGWSRAKKEALMRGRFDLLPELSRCRARIRESGSVRTVREPEARDCEVRSD